MPAEGGCVCVCAASCACASVGHRVSLQPLRSHYGAAVGVINEAVSLNCVSFYVHLQCVASWRCLRIPDFCVSALCFVCVVLLHTCPWDPLGSPTWMCVSVCPLSTCPAASESLPTPTLALWVSVRFMCTSVSQHLSVCLPRVMSVTYAWLCHILSLLWLCVVYIGWL